MDWVLNCVGGKNRHLQAAGLFLFSVCFGLWCKMTCFKYLPYFSAIGDCDLKSQAKQVLFSPTLLLSDHFHRTGTERGQCALYVHSQGQAASLSLSSWGSPFPDESPLAYGSSRLADCTYHLWPRAVLMGTKPLFRRNGLKVEGGAEGREGRGVWNHSTGEMKVVQPYCSRERKHISVFLVQNLAARLDC